MLSHVPLFATPWTVAPQVPLSMGFPRQEYWNGLPFPFPITYMAWIKNSSRVHSIIWVHSVLSVQSLSCVQHFVTPWTVAHKAFLSINNFQSLLKPLFIESVMSSNHLILCCPSSSCFQSLPASKSFQMSQFFTTGGQSIGASVLPMNIQDWFPLGWTGWISLLSKGLSRVFSNTTIQKHQFFGTQFSL